MEKSQNQFLFKKKNYLLMLAGLVLITIGFILMGGGRGELAANGGALYNAEINSSMRIFWAPFIVLCGFGIEVWAILCDPDKKVREKDAPGK